MNWSIVKLDTLYVTILIGELKYVVHKSDVTIESYDTETVLVTIELFKYAKFQVSPVDKYPICYAVNYRNCVSPTALTRDDLIIALNTILVEGVKVAKNGTLVGEQPEINFIEGANVTITTVNDNVNNKVDVTIAASGGGGGTVTSVSASVPSPTSPAYSVTVTNPTTTPAIAISALGATSQYVRGDGSLATFPAIPTVEDPFPKILMLMGG